MVARCVYVLFIVISLTLAPFVRAEETAQAAEQDFVIETIPGNTALIVDANKDEPFYRPGGSIIDRIQKYVSIFAILGKNKDGKDVINITSFNKQSALFNALPALLPQTLQERIRYPQDHLEGNELFPTVAGRACSAFKETDPEGKPLKSAIVGETFKEDFYKLLSFATVYSAISGTLKDGLTGLNLLSPRQEITVTQNNQHVLTNPNILYPCGAESAGRRVPQKELAASGSLAPGDTQQDKLFVSAPVPQDKLDLAHFISQLFAAGKCAASSECRELAMALATNATLTFAAPGYVALSGLTYDTKGDLAPNLEKENPLAYQRLTSYKGWTNTFRPAKLTFAGSLTQEDGTTRQQIIGRAETSTVQETQSLKNIPWRGSHGVIKSTGLVTDCMIMPLALQERNGSQDCNPTDDRVNRQHGSLGVPQEISTAVSATWPSDTAKGILGREFLMKQYENQLNLITTPLSQEQRNLLLQKIQSLIDLYVTTGRWPNSQLAHIDYQQQIQQTAQKYGVNEAFLYALWIEETHGSSVGDYPFGCGGHRDFSASLSCIVTDPTVQTYLHDPLPDALCMYADGHRDCTFEAHPVFVRNLMYYYDYLTNP